MKIDQIGIEMMRRALAAALCCGRSTLPNPMVGAVIFDDEGNILAEGCTGPYGSDHAERAALRKLNFTAPGFNMAVTLEPCNHYGKTPPCSEAILKAGIKRVFIAAKETNDQACGGACFLENHGVDIRFLPEFEDRVREYNRFFFKTVETCLPWVALKVATSMDGFISEASGKQTSITGEKARRHTHRLRSIHMGIAVGENTVNVDNPGLDVRMVEGCDPVPVIYSQNLDFESNRKILHRQPIIFTTSTDAETIGRLEDLACRVEKLEEGEGFVEASLRVLWKKYRINSLMVEGGGNLLASFMNSGHVDEIFHFVAPFALQGGVPMFGGAVPVERFQLNELSGDFGDDYLAVYRRK